MSMSLPVLRIIYDDNSLKMSLLRNTVQKAVAMGLSTFEEDQFYGWINPLATKKLIADCTFNGLIDIKYTGKLREKSGIFFSGIKFIETSLVDEIYIFG